MDITPNSALTAPTTSVSGSTQNSAVTSLASDFETFLKMLTAQARYQDPLQPLDSAEYASQLAQFSSVEQQVKTNDLLAAMSGQLGLSGMAQYANWIGMEARTTGPIYFNGSPITIVPETASTADRNVLVVKNASGAEVQRLELPTGNEPVAWAGVDASGAPLSSGTYSFSVESFRGDDLLQSTAAATYALVSETQLKNGQTVLILNGETEVSADTIEALRLPV